MKFDLPVFGLPAGRGSDRSRGEKPSQRLTSAILTGLLLLTAGSTAGCLNRPICGEELGPNNELVNTCVPQTTNVIVQKLVQQSVDKIDMLFVIDNSISMADKQVILVKALPDLVNRFVSPICIDRNGAFVSHPATGTEECPANSAREFSPIDNIHIGVVTTSLGGYGAPLDCVFDAASPKSEEKVDLAHLLGSLPRGAGGNTGPEGFLKWTPGANAGTFSASFGNLVAAAGEHGCGWEASLESWYRFLIEPYPYVSIARVNCPFGGDNKQSCIGPSLDAAGKELLDTTIMNQRKQFLRPDSLVAIIMLSDENDCSFRANGQSWRLAQAFLNESTINAAFKGTAVCAADPNDPCCHSCGAAAPAGCMTVPDGADPTKMVGIGCEAGKRYTVADGEDGNPDDQINLRCFEQKRRFGVDYLYPVERYSNALSRLKICPFTDDLTGCDVKEMVDNPLFDDLGLEARQAKDPKATRAVPRPSSLIFLAGIVGVPWQDVAVSADDNDPLVYRVASAPVAEGGINWDWLVGAKAVRDPLMIESVEPRTGTNPATNEPLAGVGAGLLENRINGHEWNIANRSDLQYACIFPIEDKACADPADDTDPNVAQPNCDCTEFGAGPDTVVGYNNPLCQAGDAAYDRTQRLAKAYPSLRQLEVLRDYGANSIVASICPKETEDENAADFGYRPAVGSIVARLKEQLADKCLPRELGTRDDGSVACTIVEAQKDVGGLKTCAQLGARTEVPENVQAVVRKSLESSGLCQGADCQNFRQCELNQLALGSPALEECLNSENATADGWCYIDQAKKIGNEALVEKCAPTEKRKLRFVGKGTPENGSVTFVACAGAVFDGN